MDHAWHLRSALDNAAQRVLCAARIATKLSRLTSVSARADGRADGQCDACATRGKRMMNDELVPPYVSPARDEDEGTSAPKRHFVGSSAAQRHHSSNGGGGKSLVESLFGLLGGGGGGGGGSSGGGSDAGSDANGMAGGDVASRAETRALEASRVRCLFFNLRSVLFCCGVLFVISF